MEASRGGETVCLGSRALGTGPSFCLILALAQGLCVNFHTCGKSHRKSGSGPAITPLALGGAHLEGSLTHGPWHCIS